MRRSVMPRTALAVLVFMLPCTGLAAETFELDRCIGGKCHRNGRYDSVQITEQHFIVYIDANRCPGHDAYCPTSYASFTAPDGTALNTGDYRLGDRTRGTIKVYVPRQYKGLYVKGINGSRRDDFLSLTDFEDFMRARDVAVRKPEIETSIDALFTLLAEAYALKDADRAASAYGENASYMGPRGDTVHGRAAIREVFAGLFEQANEQGDELTLMFEHVERVVEGRLAYETGYYTLTRRGPEGERISRGKFVVVARFTKGKGWSFQVDSYSPAP
ncbi:MAG: DUF4440 domain-containing protein [Acidobacteria bacterium]|nr:MAG: DUF4440 domain-containing protein [Acidobacteriota bacterium]